MRFVTILLLLLALAAGAPAQTTGAAMEGTIKAPTGALLAGTSLQLRNTKTGATWPLTTDAEGRFRAPLLPPGGGDASRPPRPPRGRFSLVSS